MVMVMDERVNKNELQDWWFGFMTLSWDLQLSFAKQCIPSCCYAVIVFPASAAMSYFQIIGSRGVGCE